MRRCSGIGVACLLAIAAPASAQEQPRPDSTPPPATTLAPALSVVVPGTGQLLRRQERGAVYLLVELFLLQRFAALWGEAREHESQYRSLALRVARAPFAPLIRDTVFEYFEQMGSFVESGPYDTDAGPAFSPPLDELTYNGSIWALARRTYLASPNAPADTASPEYRAAIAFYRRRAVGPNFRWSWRAATMEQDLYRRTIRAGDESFRRAQQQVGLLLANHFLSAVDAFVSQRLGHRREASTSGSLEHRIWLSAPRGGPLVNLVVQVRL